MACHLLAFLFIHVQFAIQQCGNLNWDFSEKQEVDDVSHQIGIVFRSWDSSMIYLNQSAMF